MQKEFILTMTNIQFRQSQFPGSFDNENIITIEKHKGNQHSLNHQRK